MILLEINCTEIIINYSLAILLALIGFFTWKWQFSYQKKVEAYTNILPYIRKLEEFYQDLYNERILFYDEYSNKMKEEVLLFLKNEQDSLVEMLIFNFGESYRSSIFALQHYLRRSAIFGWKEALNKEDKEYIREEFKKIYSIGDELKSMSKWYNIFPLKKIFKKIKNIFKNKNRNSDNVNCQNQDTSEIDGFLVP